MLEKPKLPDELVISRLQEEYELRATQVIFLPLGADPNAAVYRLVTDDGMSYFLKVKWGVFDETTVALSKFLHDQGIVQIIAPIVTKARRLWTSMADYTVILYPFVEGQNGFEVNMPDPHWVELGAALRDIHKAVLPAALTSRIRQETYSSHWRQMVREFLAHAEENNEDDPVATKLAASLRARHQKIADLVARTERLAHVVQDRSLDFVLCHSDIHAGNVLIGADGVFYIVDWDEPILAPKERDLMFVGGGVGGVWNKPGEEVLFYQGYGSVEIDAVALAYFRYARIIEDIAVNCAQIFLTSGGGANRELSYRYFTDAFLPNNVIEIACRSAI